MTSQIHGMFKEEFTAPGIVRVSASALQYARETSAVVSSRYVVTFDWAQSISVSQSADAPLEHIGACLTLAGYERRDVPAGYIQTADGLEFAIRIPTPIWQASAQRLIDLDESLPFRLALR